MLDQKKIKLFWKDEININFLSSVVLFMQKDLDLFFRPTKCLNPSLKHAAFTCLNKWHKCVAFCQGKWIALNIDAVFFSHQALRPGI